MTGATTCLAVLAQANGLPEARSFGLTAPVAVVDFMNYEGRDWGRIAAGGTMATLPVPVFSILVRRFTVRGLTAGAVKG